MSGEIERARERFVERKRAADVCNQEIAEEQKARAALSGLDLDFDELMQLRDSEVVALPVAAALSGVPLKDIFLGQWVDGVAIGLLIAEERIR